MKRIATMAFCALFVGVCFVGQAHAQQAPTTPNVKEATFHGTSAPLRDLVARMGNTRRAGPPHIVRAPGKPKPGQSGRTQEGNGATATASLQLVDGMMNAGTVGVNFDGLDNNDNSAVVGFQVAPPDPDVAVGPNHVFQMVNLVAEIFDRNGNSVMGPVPGNAFWNGTGGLCDQFNNGDPIVLYDHLADRWFVSQFAFDDGFTTFAQCAAVSATSDPTGAYHVYEFSFDDEGLPDYPKFGVWEDGYYMMSNIFEPPFFFFAGANVAVLERDAMLNGDPARIIKIQLPGNHFGYLPANLQGPAPAAGTPNYFATDALASNRMDIWEFDTDWTNPGNTSFNNVAQMPVDPFDTDVCTASREACVPQPGTTTRVETLSDRLMHLLNYRDFGTHESMVVSRTVDVGGGRTGIRWYEMRKQGGNWSVYQQGTYSPDSDFRWMPSIAQNSAGDICLAYSVSSSSTFPSIRATGQTADQSGSGNMNVAEFSIVAGNGVHSGSNRWGDYAAMKVDPVDDTTCWFTGEYVKSGSGFIWHTRIASFTLDGTGGGDSDLDLTVTPTSSTDVGPSGGRITYNFRVDNNGDADAQAQLSIEISQGGNVFRSKGPVSRTIQAGGALSANLAINIPAGAADGTYRLEGVVSEGGETQRDGFDFTKGASGAPELAGASLDWTLELDLPEGEVATTPETFTLEQNYPNPFNPSTVIAYELPQATDVTLRVFNMLGQEVASLQTGLQDAGRHEISFDASSLSAGVYLYVLEADGFTATRQMTLLK